MPNIFIGPMGRMRSGWKALFFSVTYLVATGFLSFPAYVVAELLKQDLHNLHPLFEIIPSALAVIGITVLVLRLEDRPFHSVGYRLDKRWTREFAWGISGGILLMAGTALALWAVGGFHWVADARGSGLGILLGFGIFLLVGVHEETAFRGYPFQRLVEGMGAWPTQLLLGALFAFVHLSNPGIRDAGPVLTAVTSLNIALAAILLGLCYLKTRSLALPIGLHLGWNWAQGNLLGFQVSGTTHMRGLWMPVLHDKPTWLTGGIVGLEGSVLCTLFCGAAILALILWKPKAAESVSAGFRTEDDSCLC